MKEVIIEVHGGCAVVAKQDKGTRVIIRDYDNVEDEGDDLPMHREDDSKRFSQETYEEP